MFHTRSTFQVMKRDSYFLFRSPRSYFVFVSSRILHNLHPKILSQDDYTGSPSPSRPDSFQGENHDEPRDFGPLRLQKRKKNHCDLYGSPASNSFWCIPARMLMSNTGRKSVGVLGLNAGAFVMELSRVISTNLDFRRLGICARYLGHGPGTICEADVGLTIRLGNVNHLNGI